MYRFNWIIIADALCLIPLLIIPRDLLFVRTLCLVVPSIIIIWTFIYSKYGIHPPLNVDVLVSAGTTIQLLLPSILISCTDPSLLWNDHVANRHYYPEVAFAVLVGHTAFMLGYHYSSRHKAVQSPHAQFIFSSISSFIATIFPLYFSVWVSRVFLVLTGSYYHLARSDFMNDSVWYSLLAQTSSFGIFIISGAWLCAWKTNGNSRGRAWLWLAIVITILETIWYFPSGSREGLALNGVAIVFAYIYAQRRVPYKWILVAGLVGVIFVSAMDFYRYAIADIASYNELSIDEIRDAISISKTEFMNDAGSGQGITRTLNRISEAIPIAIILDGVPDTVPYLHGETYLKALYLFVPRFLYPEKPEMILPINKWFLGHQGGSTPTTLIGEAYFNFGWLGILTVLPIIGWVSKHYDLFFQTRLNNPVWAITHTGMAVFILRLHVQPAATWLTMFLRALMIAIILGSWWRLIQRTHQRRSEATKVSIA